jgi:hypothetical protein
MTMLKGMTMVGRPIDEVAGRAGGGSERGLGPAFAWAAGGGAAVLVAAVLLYALAAAAGMGAAGMPYRELLGIFLAASLGIFIAREFDLRTG